NNEGNQREFYAALLRNRFLVLTKLFKCRDIGLVELRHMRHVEPASLHVFSGGPMDFAHGTTFDFTELAEIRQLHLRQPETSAMRTASALFQAAFNKSLNILLKNSLLRTAAGHLCQVHAK